jgi:hypothetical protein
MRSFTALKQAVHKLTNGLSRLKEQNKYAVYVSCARQSITVVRVQTMYCNLNFTIYFDFVLISTFFPIFNTSFGNTGFTLRYLLKAVKPLSKSRWPAYEYAAKLKSMSLCLTN